MWTAKAQDGSEQQVLVIVTTIPLEPADKGYKKSLVERLSRAAHDYLAELERGCFVRALEPIEGLEGRQGLSARALYPAKGQFRVCPLSLWEKTGASHQTES